MAATGASESWRGSIGRIAAVGAICALLAMIAWRYAAHWRPSSDRYPIQGVDVSEEQGPIDWPTVRAQGADFAYVRASSGSDRRDASFAANWAGARAAGLRRGALHAYSPCRPAVAQANLFIVTVPRVADALPAAVAVEAEADCAGLPDPGALPDQLARFARMVESHTGKPILLLIPKTVERRYGLAAALDRPLWATGNFFVPDYFARPWRMWRANDRRRIDGVDTPVHWDVVNGQ